jgi:imidazolonepropionase-like amidohydrolase
MSTTSVRRATALLSAVLGLAGCASAPPGKSPQADSVPAISVPVAPPNAEPQAADPYGSTYRAPASTPVLIVHATILTAASPDAAARIDDGSVLLQDGKVVAVGKELTAPPGAVVVDGTGKWVTPGIIDAHSHLGVAPSPEVEGTDDLNETTDPVTADVRAEDGLWPQDPQFPLALADGGVTSMQILPGSANLIGGRSVVVKNLPALGAGGMKFPGAPYGLKMACGENPKRVYGEGKNRAPSTRMGNIAGVRKAWAEAQKYARRWSDYEDKKRSGKNPDAPDRDIELETLAGVLAGKILVQNHCYRADEMLDMIRVSHEFGYKVSAFHHAVEAYKIAPELAREGICADVWADWWGFKMEAFDGIRENAGILQQAGACVVIHSDSAEGIQRLNQEAAKAMAAARRAGIPVTREQAIRWLTLNPARSLGIDGQTGSLEAGKMADAVVWSGDPFSVYSRPEKVYIDGALVFDRGDARRQPATDFSLGTALPATSGGVR